MSYKHVYDLLNNASLHSFLKNGLHHLDGLIRNLGHWHVTRRRWDLKEIVVLRHCTLALEHMHLGIYPLSLRDGNFDDLVKDAVGNSFLRNKLDHLSNFLPNLWKQARQQFAPLCAVWIPVVTTHDDTPCDFDGPPRAFFSETRGKARTSMKKMLQQ